jgi:putative tricarboxylic transport membrane protein
MLEHLLPAAQIFFTFQNLLVVAAGLFIGITIGAIPGLNVPMIVALLLPITFYMPPVAGISLLLGVYKGGTYGGSISAILINTPGAPAAAATCLEGYPMAKQGKAGKALRASIYGSVIGEFISDVVLISIAAQIAKVALKFGPTEKFSLVVFALCTIGVVSSEHKLKGIAAAVFGIFFRTIGSDPISGSSRFTMGIFDLIGGIPFLPHLIGLFAVSEFFVQIEKKISGGKRDVIAPVSKKPEDNRVSWKEFKANIVTIIRSTLIGIGVGALPGSGSAISAFVSYGAAKNASKKPEEYGKGSLEGVFAAETGNNAVTGGALIPLLTLGIPGDAITAIMLGAFLVHGLIPGPDLFVKSGTVIYAVFIGLVVANILHFFIASLGLRLFTKLLSVSRAVLLRCVCDDLLRSTGVHHEEVQLSRGPADDGLYPRRPAGDLPHPDIDSERRIGDTHLYSTDLPAIRSPHGILRCLVAVYAEESPGEAEAKAVAAFRIRMEVNRKEP